MALSADPPRDATPFGAILRRIVEATPGAVGGAFADSQGEMVDSFSCEPFDAHDWAVLTATYGVVLAHMHAAFGTWHFGGPEYFVAQHAGLHIVVHALDGGYYALIAVGPHTPLANVLAALRAAAHALHREMG